jgi:RNA polymerase sigma factor (sigma-70 family)
MTSATALRFPSVTGESREWERLMMARIAAGDDSALARVFDRYSDLVYGLARRLLGAAAAADVCQEVFLVLWQQPERFDSSRGSLGPFLATIARRRCIDMMRTSGRRSANEKRSSRLSPPAVPDVESAAVAIVTAERVRAAIDELPEAQREAISLAYFEGLTFRQVAVATGVSEGTAKSRLRLAQQRLAAILTDLHEAETR